MAAGTPADAVGPGALVDGPGEGIIEVTVWNLEMTDPSLVRPAGEPDIDVQLMVADRPAPQLSKWMYELVGGRWHWVDRLGWSDEQWRRWVDRPEHHLVTAWIDGAPAGYFELEEQPPSVELVHLGLTPEFIGNGLGGWLLNKALERAWAIPGTRRVWLHTCSLDGPHAVANYEARGFSPAGHQTEWRVAPVAGPR
jgi:GNAT superfamily N-acetyltransferase